MVKSVRPIFAYKKACKVIDSCTSLQQLEAANRYINLFFKYYASEKPRFSYVEYIVSENISMMYSRLLFRHNIKQRQFNEYE